MPIAVNAKTYALVKEKARAKLEYDGTYLAWLFRQELRDGTKFKATV